MANYFKELNEAFDRKFGLNNVVESKRKLKEANTDWYSMGWDDQVNAIKRFVKHYRGSKVFEDFAASVGADVDDVIDAFADMESYGVIEIPKEIQIDDKYRNDDIYESKRCNLVETAEADWDWYEDGFTSPLYRLYGQAFEEAGFDEHADVQSGMGEVYISKKGDPEGMFVANFEDVNDFMNRIHTSMVQGKLTDEKRIKEIIFQGVLDISRWRDYPDFENANESLKEDTELEADKGKKAPLTSKP